jgi:segregation and condensation protein B
LVALTESLLYVAPEPVTIANLAAATGQSEQQVEAALAELATSYAVRGLRVQRHRGRVQLVTAPEAAPFIERFLGLDLTSRLSPAALETLAIIAYRQPVTRAQIDELRGVSSEGVLRTLLHRGLVEQGERLEQAGRPFQYQTTFDFLQYFGLESLEQLPPLEEQHEDPGDDSDQTPDRSS